jgi:predicted histone-like DNA-binding protein
MSLFYNRVQRTNPSKPEEPKKWYLILKSIGRMTEKQVAKEIADETTLNPKEAEMAIYQFQKVLTKALLDGKTVQLGELGSFQLTIKSGGVDNEEEATAALVEKINIRFTPSATLKNSLNEAQFKAK